MVLHPHVPCMGSCLRVCPSAVAMVAKQSIHHSQVVVEEVEDEVYGRRSTKKERYVGGAVTPANPYYLVGLIDSRDDVDDIDIVSKPCIGL